VTIEEVYLLEQRELIYHEVDDVSSNKLRRQTQISREILGSAV